MGNDTVLSIIHEARIQFLKSLEYTEMQFAGVAMIMADAAIEFKKELFYGDVVIVSITPGEISKVGVDLFYKLEKEIPEKAETSKKVLVAAAKTGMVCYDYEMKRITTVPQEARARLTS